MKVEEEGRVEREKDERARRTKRRGRGATWEGQYALEIRLEAASRRT